jgi:hypothetical protein
MFGRHHGEVLVVRTRPAEEEKSRANGRTKKKRPARKRSGSALEEAQIIFDLSMRRAPLSERGSFLMFFSDFFHQRNCRLDHVTHLRLSINRKTFPIKGVT